LNDDNCLKALELDAISATVSVMQAHTESPVVQEMGCAILSNLARTSDETKMRIVDQEALDSILMAMVMHQGVDVQCRACMVLLHLAIEENLKPLVAAGAIEAIRAAATNYPDECEGPGNEFIQFCDDFGLIR
jgi:hypothetical protein